MLNIALELMQIVPNNFLFLSLFSFPPFLPTPPTPPLFFFAVSGCPAGAFKQSHAPYTKAYISGEIQCTNVFRIREPNNLHNSDLLPSFPLFEKVFINDKLVLDTD